MATMNRHHHHHPIECIICSRHDLAEQWLIWCCLPVAWSMVLSITKTGRHDIAEILLKVALNTKNQIKIKSLM
jgi:hypothetical protein